MNAAAVGEIADHVPQVFFVITQIQHLVAALTDPVEALWHEVHADHPSTEVLRDAGAHVADRAEAERLEVAERVTHPAHADAGDVIVHEIRLHDMERAWLERLFDRDAVVADAPEDLAHRFDRLRMRRDRDLEPADDVGVGACGGRDRRSR